MLSDVASACVQDIALKLRIPQRKPWNSMASSLSMATDVAAKDAALLVGVLPPNEAEARQLVADIQKGLERSERSGTWLSVPQLL